jgi:hypothetical protein
MGSGWIGMSGGSFGGECEIGRLLPRIYALTPTAPNLPKARGRRGMLLLIS